MAYVLDTSAILTILYKEPGYETVQRILSEGRESSGPEGSGQVYLPFLALMELGYLCNRRFCRSHAHQVLRIVENFPVRIVESDPRWRREAARLKASNKLSLADAWNAALAIMLDAHLIHKDPEFEGISELKTVTLPYKSQEE